MKAKTLVKTQPFKVVLNGGSDIMESATIPVTFFFDDSIIEKEPHFILVIEQSEKESKLDDGNAPTQGHRQIVKVEDGVIHIQFLSSGWHRIVFIVVGDIDSDTRKKFLKKVDRKNYDYNLPWQDMTSTSLSEKWSNYHFLTSTVAEPEVPKELFSKKGGGTVLGKAFYDYVNRWYEVETKDPCKLRRRIPFTLFVQTPLILLGRIFTFIAASIIFLFLFICRVVMSFLGFMPAGLTDTNKVLWRDLFWRGMLKSSEKIENVCKFPFDLENYRRFTNEKRHSNLEYVPTTPLELSIIGGLIYFLVYDFKNINWLEWGWWIPECCGIVMFLSSIVSRILKMKNEARWGTRVIGTGILFALWFLMWFVLNTWKPTLWFFGKIGEFFGYIWEALFSATYRVPQIDTHQVVQSFDFPWMNVLLVLFSVVLIVSVFKKYSLWEKLTQAWNKWLEQMKEKNALIRIERQKTLDAKNKLKREAREERKRRQNTTYKEWLSGFHIKNATEKVELSKIPVPMETTRQVVQKFKVAFWFTKARICKPYEE